MRNGGTAPAIRATPMLGLLITGIPDPHADDANRTLCAPRNVKNQLSGSVSVGTALILPNSEAIAPIWGLQRNPPWSPATDGKVFASISGCIGYLDEIDEPHATFVSLLLRGDFIPPVTGRIDRQWLAMPFVPTAY